VTAIPPLLLLTASVILGVMLGIQYLQRKRGPPTLIGFHLLLGAGGLEVLAMLLHGTPDRRIVPSGGIVTYAAGLLLAAMFTGLLVPLIGRRSRPTMNVALAIHVGVGAAGFVLFLVWMAGSMRS
jgi:hypothetical protein